MSKLQRRLAAIMFTDIVGYSAMMQKDEVIANRKRKRHKDVFTSLIAEYDGQILQYYGDGTLSIFNSTAAAVECAVSLQTALKQEPKVSIRIGIHTGDITLSEDDIFGDGVNIASRIESLCVPGGIFVSGKVYDDIKNHPTLKAQSVGSFDLKNINDKTQVYAITNKGLTVPEEKLAAPTTINASTILNLVQETERKNKIIASILALLLGVFGVHRFYLGKKGLGIANVSVGLVGIILGVGFLITATALLGLVDALILFTMPQQTFDKKYNQGETSTPTTANQQSSRKQDAQLTKQKSLLKAKFERHKKMAKAHYKEGNYRQAIQVLEDAVEIKYDDMDSHFLLAKGYSMIEDARNALIHLDAAIAFGLDTRKAKFDHALAFLRTRSAYKAFVASNYRILDDQILEDTSSYEPTTTTSFFDDTPDLLEQLNKLQELRARGFLTEEEFLQQQEKLRR